MDLKTKRWFVLLASVAINLCIGSGYAWSVFAKPMVVLLGCTAAAATLAFTISNSFGPVTMILGGRMQDKFGPKWVIVGGAFLFAGGVFLTGFTTSVTWLYMSYGVLMGLGMGAIYSCTIANTVKFFPDKRGLVSGIATAGYGAGSILVPPLANALIASQGILATFRTLGIAYFIIIVVGSFFVMTAPAGYKPEGWNPPAPTATSTVSGEDKNWNQMLADPMFYVLLIMLTAGAFAGLMIISQASPIAQEVIKVTPAVAAVAVSMIALANTAGRIFWGWISDKIGRYVALTIMYIISGVAVFALTGISSYAAFLIAAMLVGLCFGGIMGIFPALTADMFGSKNNGVNYGIMFSGFAIAGLFGPMTAATVKASHNGDYTIAFIIAACCSVLGIVLTLVVRSKTKKNQEAALAAKA
ncbi:putative MFS-type transporter YhjX [Pelotomaculum schinkii]|uniref:Putative MFS-type transporter YhjX n=1 Tax=Pelotomaculum schinkii TaxID=78350 RepID=A0A4Y7RB37_9FIRM|nr:OFA family MFS transporter [Pelotomaculum schinkii]TEB06215.1 putative MFS-type transporter YhjX [Pelotomaculum schinkii]